MYNLIGLSRLTKSCSRFLHHCVPNPATFQNVTKTSFTRRTCAGNYFIRSSRIRYSRVTLGARFYCLRLVEFVGTWPRARFLLTLTQRRVQLLVGVGSVFRVALSTVNCEQPVPDQIESKQEGERPTPQPNIALPWTEFLKYLLPEIWLVLGAILSALAVAIINTRIPILLGQLVEVMSKFTRETSTHYIDELQKPAFSLFAIYCLQGGMTFIYISMLSCMGERIAARMRKDLFASLLQQDIAFFDVNRTGELINIISADVQDFKSSFKLCISQGLRSITQIIGSVVSLYTLSPKLTATLIVTVPSLVAIGTLLGSLLRKLSRKAQDQLAKSVSVADEALSNIRTVRAFAMEGAESGVYAAEVEKASQLNQQLGIGIGAFQGLSNLALNGVVLGVLFGGGMLISTSELKAGDLMAFLVASQTIQRSLASVAVLFGQSVRGVAAAARIMQAIAMEPFVAISQGNTIAFHSFMPGVEFNNVTFRYPTRKGQVVLNDFSLKIPHGKMVALVGLSGSGKSTVAALLERFYEIDSGAILLDSKDICTLNPSWLRGKVIGFINQEPVLFATSIMENIRYGNTDATDQEVYEAAQIANADEFIRSFPHGYQTVLGERGVTVSGGQKQRIAIARALIKNPSILILDEATSALDAESERLVQEALDRVCKGRTVLVIAHRLSTIQKADQIAVMKEGKVKEVGTHRELLRKRGVYAELIQRQTIDE